MALKRRLCNDTTKTLTEIAPYSRFVSEVTAQASSDATLGAPQLASHWNRWNRWSDYNVADWERIQRIGDDGGWIASEPNHRFMWIDGTVKPWMLFLKRTVRNELYMASYQRATRREVANWQEGS